MSAFSFKFMYFILKFRDAFLRPRKILNKIEDIRNGVSILDYGCGPGSFTMVAAEMVGKDGTVIAADIHPLAIKQRSASKKGLKNIKTILHIPPQVALARIIPILVSLVWLGIGIRQWFVLSKWSKKYERYKELQKRIDAKLDYGNNHVEDKREGK